MGVAPNKFLAKLASDLEKPDGLTVIAPETIHEILDPLAVRKLWGVGPACEKRLAGMNIRTIGQLRRLDEGMLRSTFGELGEHLSRLSRGLDTRAVTPDSRAKSISQETTFATDVGDMDIMLSVLLSQCEHIVRRLRRNNLLARTITLKLRYGDFTTITRSTTLPDPTDSTSLFWRAAKDAMLTWENKSFRPLRLLGLGVSQLQQPAGRQLGLFDTAEAEKQRKPDTASAKIVEKFGHSAIRRGLTIKPPRQDSE